MASGALNSELGRIGRMVAQWRAQLFFTFCAAGIIFFLWVFGLFDLTLQLAKFGRIVSWTLLVVMGGAMSWWMGKIVSRKTTPQGVASKVESAFPQLDNHLINYLQFSNDQTGDAFKAAYVKKGVQGFRTLRMDEMKNRKAHRRASYCVLAASVILLIPSAFVGRAWPVALWRIVNPFSNTLPLSLTKIIEVRPGDSEVLQGKPLELACDIDGKKGHKVWLDVKPADGEETTYSLGKIDGKDLEEFTHRIHKVNTDIKYRFRAGDAPFPKWYEVNPRPPLAFTAVTLDVVPPSYTKQPNTQFDGMSDEIQIPQGSQVAVTVKCSGPVTELKATSRGNTMAAFTPSADRKTWKGKLSVVGGSSLHLEGANKHEEHISSIVGLGMQADRPPAIQIVEPKGRPMLPPGTAPSIDFAVADDYGVTEVIVEKIVPGTSRKTAGTPLKTWQISNAKDFSEIWKGEIQKARDSRTIAFRLVAKDNCAFDPHLARSSSILFNAVSIADANSERKNLEDKAFLTLGKVIELQRNNIAKTRTYEKILASSQPEHWKETADTQTEIRELTKTLLSNPAKPLGNLKANVSKLYVNEMRDVITTLRRVATSSSGRAAHVTRALNMEEKILRQLTYAEVGAAQTKVNQRASALSSMLGAMIKTQTKILKTTGQYAASRAKIGETLIDNQDALASDVTAFIAACKTESEQVTGNDAGYAALLMQLAEACASQNIRGDMLQASDQLDQNAPAGAIPHEKTALAKLKAIQVSLDKVEMKGEDEDRLEMLEALHKFQEKTQKVIDIQEKVLESMEMVKDQKHQDANQDDLLEEEFAELMANTKESMLEVPKDLQIFMELNCANELCEDVFSVFEEVEAKIESGSGGATGDVAELAFAKIEGALEGMEEVQDRQDKMEHWLGDGADNLKVSVEPFDQEEMPEAGMSLGALAAESESLIGDLLEESDAAAAEAADTPTNLAVPDKIATAEVAEGETASFGAQGEPGNAAPDHKEQDGRSNIGRQGMSSGETAAGSGTIGEGDKNIEERRTQDPTQEGQVQLDGEADTKATGGGKLASGKGDSLGDVGGEMRMDSTEEGSGEGMESLMAKQADAMYAKASMQNVRAESLKAAAHHLRQAADCDSNGNIKQLKEHKKRAIAALKKARTQLEAGTSAVLDTEEKTQFLEDVVEGGSDEAPERYRDLVSEYYKKLNDSL